MRHNEIVQILVDYLRASGSFQNRVVINELKLGIGGPRADLAVFGDSFHGFEIKSQYDSVKRLENQLHGYLDFFDFVILVVAEKHVSSVENIAPRNVGIWKIDDVPRPQIAVVRRPQLNIDADSDRLLELLWKSELISSLKNASASDNIGPIFNKGDLRKSLSTRLNHAQIRRTVAHALANRVTLASRRSVV